MYVCVLCLITELALYIVHYIQQITASTCTYPPSLFCQIKKDGIGPVYCYPPTQVSVIDAAAMGEALDTFTICASPIHCIATVPGFNENDPDVLTSKTLLIRATCMHTLMFLLHVGLSTVRKKSVSSEVRPSSKFATMWMGSEPGEYVLCVCMHLCL